MQSGDDRSVITVEEYVARVTAHEMPYTFHKEALKAQAVAARTYLYYCLENGSHPHDGADVCDDITHCCGYITEDELAERYGTKYAEAAMEAVRDAANATKGEVLMYDGEPILSVWHSSSEGTTEDSGAVWMHSLPYLRSVSTPEKMEATFKSFTLTELAKLLRGAGCKYNGGTNIRVHSTLSGRCKGLTIGNAYLSGSAARSLFGLRSTDFTVNYHGGRLYFTVYGYGHGVGMSQYGANKLAEDGSDYREILSHYYVGSDLKNN